MFNELVKKVKEEYRKATQAEVVHPEIFQDTLATKVSWVPLKNGGANFRTHKVIKVDENNLEVQPTLMSKIFAHIFMIAGAVMIAYSLYKLSEVAWQFQEEDYFLFGGGLLFCVISIVFNIFMVQKKYFDKTQGYYWVGKKGPREVYNPNEDKHFTKLSAIYALQIIKERIRSDKGNYNSYELNLVCKDKSRVNVMDHAKIDSLREDAQTISQFLGVPLWDST
ncbi:hypothetical protein [Saccharicrinis sp. 156]|uniref:hypothetical protein n=1 Tax=Saccharicrinis sp. 156 TaxID=3417574 RepID=UPI003D33845A